MSVGQALAVVALWQSRSFSTYDIAGFLNVHKSDVERVIHIHREEQRMRA